MFDDRFIDNKYLKLDSTYSNLPEKLFYNQYPDEVPRPEVAMINESLAESLKMNLDFLKSDDGLNFLSGNKVISSSNPISQAYAGHQFGHFTMLGDGRAVLLGEIVADSGKRYDIQLKGSGSTPYSRGGDGKASLGPMLREYIISEAMHALKIKTTRSLAVIKTGENILRERGYETGAVLTRIAESFLRVGTFQYASYFTDYDTLKALADYAIERHFMSEKHKENQYIFLFKEVMKRQAELIAKWQSVGFIHGVMNTDNMSICGETIDYGPCAFMDIYDPETVFSSIDTEGRYAYGNQPQIAYWNLARFGESLIPLISSNEDEAVRKIKESLSDFTDIFKEKYYKIMRNKIGLFNEKANDELLISDLLDLMYKNKADYTNTFLYLTIGDVSKITFSQDEGFKKWYIKWQERLKLQKETKDMVEKLMKSSNPVVIPRNERVEEVLDRAVKHNDYSTMQSFLKVINNPYDYDNLNEYYINVSVDRKVPYKTYCGT